MEVNEIQFLNVSVSIFVNPSGSVIDCRLTQSSNALFLIVVTLLGIVILVNPLLAKLNDPMFIRF